MFSKKCEICKEKKLPKEPYVVQVVSDDQSTISFQVCDECGTLLDVMREQMERALNDESL